MIILGASRGDGGWNYSCCGRAAGKLCEETKERTEVALRKFAACVELAAAQSEHPFVIGGGEEGEGVHGGDGVVCGEINRERARLDRKIWSGAAHGRAAGACQARER